MDGRHTASRFLLITLTLLLFAVPVFCQGGSFRRLLIDTNNADRIRQQDMSTPRMATQKLRQRAECPQRSPSNRSFDGAD